METQKSQYDHLVLQTEKLSALGRMAAGIAHEINNPLAGILLYSTNLLKKAPKDGPMRDGLEIIVHETQRCGNIIQELLEFSRQGEPDKALANINDVITKALNIVENELRLHHIEMRKQLSDDMEDIFLDANQMEQVFVNLLLNAVEAIQERGKVTIRSHMGLDEKSEIVEIEDTGCGISPENVERIFEPFFSTKAHGTGLGLAVSFGIVQKHGGKIKVASRVGHGTKFTIELPLVPMAAASETKD
jgi:signal transduction histidine kinase